MPQHPELLRTLDRVRHRIRLSRGRGGMALDALLRRLHQGEVEMDEQTALQVNAVIESLVFAHEDVEAEKNRMRREPWRML